MSERISESILHRWGRAAVTANSQLLEPGITVDLQNAAESFEVSGWALRPAIRTIEVDGGRWVWPGPRAIVARINPEPTGLGTAAAGIEHRDRGVFGEQLL